MFFHFTWICLRAPLSSAFFMYQLAICGWCWFPQVITLKLAVDYGLPSSLGRCYFHIWTFSARFLYLCVYLFNFFFVLFSFLVFFFWQDVCKIGFFYFPLSFFTNWELMIMKKTEERKKIGCAFVLCCRYASRNVNVGVENVSLHFLQRLITKKIALCQATFKKLLLYIWNSFPSNI